jgi:hypothetical protein
MSITTTTHAPFPTDPDALKIYRVSSQGNWIPKEEDVGLSVTPDAGWYRLEWIVHVEKTAANDRGIITLRGGGLKSQDERGNGTYSLHFAGTSITAASNNSIATNNDRTAQGSITMFLDGTEVKIWAYLEPTLSVFNQFVFTRFAFPNGNDLG